MGILNAASGASIWRGYDYYKEKKVLFLTKISDNVYGASVKGSRKTPYTVELHIDHPRSSSCDCPHASGRRVVCKHMVAAYFAAFPEEAERFYREAMASQAEEQEWQEELAGRVEKYIMKMKKSELQQALCDLLFEGPDWQFDRFVEENGLDDE